MFNLKFYLFKVLIPFFILALFLTNCAKDNITNSVNNPNAGEPITDIDGNVYQTINIGDQLWMAENLKVTHYRNGDAITHITDNKQWANDIDWGIDSKSGKYCSYENNDTYVSTYGRMYNWYAANDNRGLAPEGWHLPTDEEWKELEMYLGMSQADVDDSSWRGTDEGSKLKSTVGWNNHFDGTSGNGTNESGFSALPGGRRIATGDFGELGNYAYYFSATNAPNIDDSETTWNREIYYGERISRGYVYKMLGMSVRCIKD